MQVYVLGQVQGSVVMDATSQEVQCLIQQASTQVPKQACCVNQLSLQHSAAVACLSDLELDQGQTGPFPTVAWLGNLHSAVGYPTIPMVGKELFGLDQAWTSHAFSLASLGTLDLTCIQHGLTRSPSTSHAFSTAQLGQPQTSLAFSMAYLGHPQTSHAFSMA